MATHKTVHWTLPMLNRLKQAYKQHASAGKAPMDTFVFEHSTFVMSYARYVIEYLDVRLPPAEPAPSVEPACPQCSVGSSSLLTAARLKPLLWP